jgi:hypothetical protein
LAVEFSHRLFQHLTMARVTGGLELLGETLAGKQEAIAFPVVLLLVGRDGGVAIGSRSRPLFLLLFYRLTLPSACHLRNLTSKWAARTKKHLL